MIVCIDVIDLSLTWFLFVFLGAPEEEGGSAVTGYKFQIQHTGQEFDLPRTQKSYLVEFLHPGKSYLTRVLAINKVGASEYSEWSDSVGSKTLSDRPEKPMKPKPVSGTWATISFSAVLPFANGSRIVAMQVQRRELNQFLTGLWSEPVDYRIPQDITVLEEVDFEQQQLMLQMKEMEQANEKKKLADVCYYFFVFL